MVSASLTMVALGMKSRPLMLQTVPLKTREVKFFSFALSGSIVLVALLFGGLVLESPLAGLTEGACEDPSDTIGKYTEQIKEYIGYYDAEAMRLEAEELEIVYYTQAREASQRWRCDDYTHDCIWAVPCNPECIRTVTHVKGGCQVDFNPVLNFLGAADQGCVADHTIVTDPCANSKEANVGPVPRKTERKPLKRFDGDGKYAEERELVENIVVEIARDVTHKGSIASSVYCLWVAAMVFIGPAYSLYGVAMGAKVQSMLDINKMLFIFLVVSSWTIYEYVEEFVVLNPRAIKLAMLAQKDPCFMSPEFLTKLGDKVADICDDVTYNHQLFNHTNGVIDYYMGVENTWVTCGRQDSDPVYRSNNARWEFGCEENSDFFKMIGVPDTESNGLFYLVYSGQIAGVFLQALLVNMMWYIADIAKPLCGYNGRVISDPNYYILDSPHAFDAFIRVSHIRGLLFNALFLSFVLANLFWPEDFAALLGIEIPTTYDSEQASGGE